MSETTPERLNTGSHDLPVSPALAEFMTQSWAPATAAAPGPLDVAPYAAKRRARLSARFPGERLVIPAGGLQVRSNDVDYRFRPHSAYTYLTGDTAAETGPDGVLVMEPTGTGHDATLYIRPRSTRDTGEFYRDRRYGEFWVGRRNTLAETSAALGLDCVHLDRLPTAPARTLDADDEFTGYLSEMRLIKDEWEVAQITDAVRYTETGFGDAVAALPQAVTHRRGERWVEGVFNLAARLEGNGLGYETIAAAGAARLCPALDPQRRLADARASCCCWTPEWRPTPSIPPTSPARCRSPAASVPSSAGVRAGLLGRSRRGSPPSAPAPGSATSTGPRCGHRRGPG